MGFSRRFRIMFICVLTFLMTFSAGACTESNSTDIVLTKSNIKQYVDLDCRAIGAYSTYTNGKYYGMTGSATVQGKSDYYYDNVVITITIYFDDGINDAYPTLYLYLDSNGNSTDSQYFTILNKTTKTLAYVTSSSIAANSTYVIEDVRGSIKRI